jgi:hypothetical protein
VCLHSIGMSRSRCACSKSFVLICIIAILVLSISALQLALWTSRPARKSQKQFRAVPSPQVLSPQLQTYSLPATATPVALNVASQCNSAPFFSRARIGSMIAAGTGLAWQKSYPSWDKWMNFFSRRDEYHMRDNPNGRDHFPLLAALLDAAPQGQRALQLRVHALVTRFFLRIYQTPR